MRGRADHMIPQGTRGTKNETRQMTGDDRLDPSDPSRRGRFGCWGPRGLPQGNKGP